MMMIYELGCMGTWVCCVNCMNYSSEEWAYKGRGFALTCVRIKQHQSAPIRKSASIPAKLVSLEKFVNPIQPVSVR